MAEHKEEHHIISFKTYILVILALLALSILTVSVSYVDFGSSIMNFFIAMTIACIKSSLVFLFFMGLRWDSWLNRISMFGSILALLSFVFLTASDLWYRIGDDFVAVKELHSALSMEEIKKLELGNPAALEKGKLSFTNNCVSCHGTTGKGDGDAASALAKKPRNFSEAPSQWVNGVSPESIFITITEGIAGTPMAGYASLSVEDRWALVHYILSLISSSERPRAGKRDADYKKLIAKLVSGKNIKKTIPIDLAKEIMLREKKK